MTPARKALAVATLAVALFAAVIVQLTVVNRLPLPGGSAPDLVLLLVTAIAVVTTPALATIAGFAGGLAVDVAPPAAHYVGEYALVFCLASYGAARVSRAIANATGERDPVAAFTVMAVAAAAGEAGKAALGLLLSAPDVTTAAVSRVLPGAILYDLLLSLPVFWLVARVTRGAVAWSGGAERAPAPEFSREQRLALVFRQASVGAAPGLRLAGTGKSYESPSVAGRIPKLRLSDGRAGPVPRTVPGSSGVPRSPLPAGRTRKLDFAGDLPRLIGRHAPTGLASGRRKSARPRRFANGSLAGGRSPQAGWLSGGRSATPPVVRRTPRNGWLGSTRGRPRTVIGSSPLGGRRSFHGKNRHFTARAAGLLRMIGVTK